MMQSAVDALRVTILAEDSVPYESPFWGQHGFSCLIETYSGDDSQRIVVDVAAYHEALMHNVELAGLDPATVDAVVLTHCHYDHTQGLVKFIKAVGKTELPVVAHPTIFRPNLITEPGLRDVGVPRDDGPEYVREAGGTLVLASNPVQLGFGVTTTGEVPRVTSFEDPGLALCTIEDGKLVPDAMLDDISVVVRVRDQGLVVVTGCSHAGIINILKHVEASFPGEKICGVIGGFHLVEAADERIDKTVEALSGMGMDWVASGHCTGFRAQIALQKAFGESFEPLGAGKVFEIGA